MIDLEVQTLAALSAADHAAVEALRAAAGTTALSEFKLRGLGSPPVPTRRHVVAWCVDRLVGYGALGQQGGTWNLELLWEPGVDGDDVVTAMVLEALRGDVFPLRLWSRQPPLSNESTGRARALGFVDDRSVLRLERGVHRADFDAGASLEVRPFDLGRDASAWLALNARAFAAHPEQGSWDLAELNAHLAQPWHVPALFLVTELEGAMVAWCWCKVTTSDEGVVIGEIYVIGVDPSAHGRGLGSAMLTAGCAAMAAHGAQRIELYVEADNVPALSMYERHGFEVAERISALRLDSPGADEVANP